MQVWWDFPLLPTHPPTNNNANPGFGSFGYFVALLKQLFFPALSLSLSLSVQAHLGDLVFGFLLCCCLLIGLCDLSHLFFAFILKIHEILQVQMEAGSRLCRERLCLLFVAFRVGGGGGGSCAMRNMCDLGSECAMQNHVWSWICFCWPFVS